MRNSSRHSYSFTQAPGISGQATNGDYSKSGYDRGHMCPAADCLWSGQAMKESFLMVNITPQKPDLNRNRWEKLEQACRDSALVYDSLVIRAGVYVEKPLGRLGKTGILIPSKFYKKVTYWRRGRSYTKCYVFENK